MRTGVDVQVIQQKIFLIRGQKVMLDRDLAELYGVETGALNQAVKRNKNRFPCDFMFQLTKAETQNWISQIVISNKEKMGLRKDPFAFTEHGILMLSSVLNSERAVQVNIAIMRAFVKLRKILSGHNALAKKLGQLERRMDEKDEEVQRIFDAIRRLMAEDEKPKGRIGFHA
jgi:phage regulator Rha-like protein